MFDTFTSIATKALLFLCVVAAVQADVLPAAVTLAECVDSTVTDDPSSCSVSGRDASASGSLTRSPFVSLTAQDNTGPANEDFNPGAGVVVSATYSFEVVGGNPGDVVPILISTNLSANGSSFSHAYGFAELTIHTSFGNQFAVVCSNGTCGTTATSFSGTLSQSAQSGEGGDTVQLEVEAESGDSPLAESANASADPFLFIDPNFAGAANYQIELSPGVGNGIPSSAAPEPGTLGLLGTVLVAVVVRHRKVTLA